MSRALLELGGRQCLGGHKSVMEGGTGSGITYIALGHETERSHA